MTISWPSEFAPSYTPEQMLRLGVFEGKYINNIQGIPKKWKKLPRVLQREDEPDPSLNQFGVKSRKSLQYWQDKGWIMTDANGWFEWYIHFYWGRRLGEEDQIQIKRWRSFVARHVGQLRANVNPKNLQQRPVQRQALLQWAWDSTQPFTDDVLEQNRRRLQRKTTDRLRFEGRSMEHMDPW